MRPQNAIPSAPRATVLFVSPFDEDHDFLGSVFKLPNWNTYTAWTYRDALKWLMRDRMTLIICESHLPDGDWKDILSQAQVLPEPPYFVLASRLAADDLWIELLTLGGFDLVAKPFVREEVVRVAETAFTNWKREVEKKAPAARARAVGASGGF